VLTLSVAGDDCFADHAENFAVSLNCWSPSKLASSRHFSAKLNFGNATAGWDCAETNSTKIQQMLHAADYEITITTTLRQCFYMNQPHANLILTD
jgi:hypothetical protein